MGQIIAIANQKGGVGKTTTCINLAASLASLQRRILLVDLDPQGNATMSSGIEKNALEHTVKDALVDDVPVNSILLATRFGYDMLPGNRDLTIAEVALLQKPRREFRLHQILIKLRDSYDYVLIDCPPALNMLTVNALVAARGVIIPMQCEYFALEGLSALMDTIKQLRTSVNPYLSVLGILRTMYDGRNCLSLDVSQQLQQHFSEQLLQTTIPRNVRLAEAPSHGMPALIYDKRSQGAQAYLELAKELLQRQEHRYQVTTESTV